MKSTSKERLRQLLEANQDKLDMDLADALEWFVKCAAVGFILGYLVVH